jgi:transposase InsO family protein
MKVHANAALGPAGRLALVEAIESGMTATAHRWWHRRLRASTEELQLKSWLLDRSSRPHRSPRLLDEATQERICEWRRRTGWGPRLVAGKVGRHHSTVWKVLARHGISRPARAPREEICRYEWPCPGDLLHMDTSRYARFERPGHAVTGDRSQRSRKWMDPKTRVGYDFCHAIVDDHSRLAYVELHPDEKATTVTAFVERALAFFASHGIESKRLMTDNAFAYAKNCSLREVLAAEDIKHFLTQPYRPQTNGKIERFHQTMAREWAYGMAYRSTTTATVPCHTGCGTTTRPGPTAHLEAGRRSAAFTTSVGRTAS